uniref:Peptidase S1 domain-containing protein n=1 Tax=Latimeria chalumnae TaxID=7897 RepID=H3A3H4_LATCH
SANYYRCHVSSLYLCVLFKYFVHLGVSVEIIGGHEAKPHSRPYMALIEDAKGKPFCGGTLIKANWVLTAAHCNRGKPFQVILGAHSISADDKNKQKIKVKKAVPNSCFDNSTGENDIMLLQLDRKAVLNKTVSILELPGPKLLKDVKAGTTCTIIGWGATSKKEELSDKLMEATVKIVDRKICNSHKFWNFNPVITTNMLCAGDIKGKKDSCKGDSGGPLICKKQLSGITSFGPKCGTFKKPGIYTRLTENYVLWIQKKLQELD